MIGSLLLLIWLSNGAEADQGYKPLTAALHVHSRFSNGQHEVFERATQKIVFALRFPPERERPRRGGLPE
jgi:hypothetical protein